MTGGDLDWHLKKEVSYGHIISTALLAGMLIAGWIDVQNRLTVLEEHPRAEAHLGAEKRLDVLETEIVRVQAVDAAMKLRLEDLHAEILRRFDRQDMKLDRIENRLNEHDTRNDSNG